MINPQKISVPFETRIFKSKKPIYLNPQADFSGYNKILL
jgi:hypothetical protein